jgi:hypothetical protein
MCKKEPLDFIQVKTFLDITPISVKIKELEIPFFFFLDKPSAGSKDSNPNPSALP